MFKKNEFKIDLKLNFKELQNDNYVIDINYLIDNFFNKNKVLLEFIKVYNVLISRDISCGISFTLYMYTPFILFSL